MDLRNTWDKWPDANGRFGEFGGRYVAETLMPLVLELEEEYKCRDVFWAGFRTGIPSWGFRG